MKKFIENLNIFLDQRMFKIKACCCGHDRRHPVTRVKYPMTVVIEDTWAKIHFELISGIMIPRKKKFYVKDRYGFYYIPETIKHANIKTG